MNFEAEFGRYREALDASLPSFLPRENGPESRVTEAMAYGLLSGGKRIRGVLTLSVAAVCGSDTGTAMPFAAAVEMIHAYSLIHDDLPCMDNDDLRRGRPSCHAAFGEATALLAGDALLTRAFEILPGACSGGSLSPEAALRAVRELAGAAGAEGMVGGQQMDIGYGGKTLTPGELRLMNGRKTGALITAAAKLGCIAAGAPDGLTVKAAEYAEPLGLAFQIVDDVLDATKSSEELGKSVSDRKNGKTTWFTLLGEEAARELARELALKAELAIRGTLLDRPFLRAFAEKLAVRDL